MGLRIKIDEDLPLEIVQELREAGHDAVTVVSQGWGGREDSFIWGCVQTEGRWLITADKGFADARKYCPSGDTGLLLLRLPRESRRGYLELVRTVLHSIELTQHAGAIIVASPAGIRVHQKP